MSKPQILLLDEPSLGLAPIVIDNMFETIRRLNRELGLTILVVEQMQPWRWKCVTAPMSWKQEKSAWRAAEQTCYTMSV